MQKCAKLSMLAAMLSMFSLGAEAQEVVNIADVRCVVVGMQLSGMTTSPKQSRGILLTLYYVGRLNGRAPKLDIEGLIIAETGRMTDSDFASEATRCEAGLAERGQQITQIGKDMMERDKKTPAH